MCSDFDVKADRIFRKEAAGVVYCWVDVLTSLAYAVHDNCYDVNFRDILKNQITAVGLALQTTEKAPWPMIV